jgi:hypothetical protein
LAACATQQRSEDTSVVRTRPPANYKATIASYFDLHDRSPQTNRKLAFGAPESSGCALRGSAGAYRGWMVPVIYDTSASTSARGAKTSGSGTSAAAGRAAAAKGKADRDAVSLDEVHVSGKGYFFWFSNETISGVSRRADGCP